MDEILTVARSNLITTKELIRQIEWLKKKKLSSNPIVSLKEYRRASYESSPQQLVFADSDEELCCEVQIALQSQGFRVFVAHEIGEFLRLMETHFFSLFILDAELPGVGGIELCKLLKQHDLYRTSPLVLTTSSSQEVQIKKAFESGCDDLVLKPFDLEEILSVVDSFLG